MGKSSPREGLTSKLDEDAAISISNVREWPEHSVPQGAAGSQTHFPHICRAVANAKKQQKEKRWGRQSDFFLVTIM